MFFNIFEIEILFSLVCSFALWFCLDKLTTATLFHLFGTVSAIIVSSKFFLQIFNI